MASRIADNLKIGRRGTWRTCGGTNGLPGPAIALYEASTGYLWIATEVGYEGGVDPDHTPGIVEDEEEGSRSGWALAVGQMLAWRDAALR